MAATARVGLPWFALLDSFTAKPNQQEYFYPLVNIATPSKPILRFYFVWRLTYLMALRVECSGGSPDEKSHRYH